MARLNVLRLSQLVMRFFRLVIDSGVHWTPAPATASTMKGSFPLFVRYCDTIYIAQMTTTISSHSCDTSAFCFIWEIETNEEERERKMACCQHNGFIYPKVVSIQLNYCLQIRFYSIKFSQVVFFFISNDSYFTSFIFIFSLTNIHFFDYVLNFFYAVQLLKFK